MAVYTTTPPPVRKVLAMADRAGLRGALASEATKIRTVRSTYWTLISFIVVSIGLGAAVCAAAAASLNAHPHQKVGFDAAATSLFLFFYLGELIIAVLGAMTITAEYSTGMIRTSLAVQPRRATVYAAKVLVFTAVGAVVSFAVAFVAFFLGQALLSSTGVSASLSQPNVTRAVVAAALLVTLAGLLAFGIGAIIRHTAGAITTVIGILFVLPIIVGLLPDSWSSHLMRWLPTSAGSALLTTVGSAPAHLFAGWGQFAVTAGWAVIAVGVGGYLFLTRDA